MVGKNLFRKLHNSMKAETVRLCSEAEQHNFCPNCGMLLCNGELCEQEPQPEPEEDDTECIQCGSSSGSCSCVSG